MATSLLRDAFAHHLWATERLMEACEALAPERLEAPASGTYGSIIETFRHFVGSDGWYLSFFRPDAPRVDEDAKPSLAELRSAMESNGAAWLAVLDEEVDADRDVVEMDNGWEFHAPVGLRLAQVVQHGTDHRSQICTALSSFGIEPPGIDLWDFGTATGRTRAVPPPGQ
jgi:uncharacterized damage-inducible protein DinB